ncbi:hypothetical protein QBC42DRAFT_232386, partial [Cladorrhinum samala]
MTPASRPILSHHYQTAQIHTHRSFPSSSSSPPPLHQLASASTQQSPPFLSRSATYAPGVPVRPPSTASASASARARAQAQAQLFTCTFCWRLSSPSSSSTLPRVIGRGARLACERCYASLLGLSICWVCGGLVYRGEECVSLGWTFWHRACYGCLFCGNKRVARGVTVGELYEDEEEDGNRGPPMDNGVREIEEVPVCANCLVDLEAEDEKEIAKRAVRRVEKSINGDGGMGRVRWERREADRVIEERLERMGRGDEKQQVHLHKRPIVDGPCEQERGEQEKEVDTIYVSLTDPFGEMSFRPSPTKPIPEWMRPNSGYTTDERNRYKQESSMDSTICPDDDKSSFESRQRLSGELSGVLPRPNAQPAAQNRRFLHRGTSFVSAEPLTLPSSLAHQRVTPSPVKATLEDEMSNTSTFSVYLTPPEYPSPRGSSSRREDSNDSEAAYPAQRHSTRVDMLPQPQQSRLLTRHLSNLAIASQPKIREPTTDLARHSTTSLRPQGTVRTATSATHIHRGGGLSANASVEYLVEPFEKRLQRQKEREKELTLLGLAGGQAGGAEPSFRGRGRGTIKLRAKTFLEHLDLEQERERERERRRMEREAQPAPLRLGSSRQGAGGKQGEQRERMIRQDDGDKNMDKERRRNLEREGEQKDKEKEKGKRGRGGSQTSSASKLGRRDSLL